MPVRIQSNWNTHALLVGMQNGTYSGKQVASIKLNIHLPCDPAIPLLSICSREMKTYVFKSLLVYSSSGHNCQKTEAMQIPFNRGMSKQTAAHLDNKILLSKRKKKILKKLWIYATMWMNFKGIMLCERIQYLKVIYCIWINLCDIHGRYSYSDGNSSVVAREWGGVKLGS